jgi:hypothetical protein
LETSNNPQFEGHYLASHSVLLSAKWCQGKKKAPFQNSFVILIEKENKTPHCNNHKLFFFYILLYWI